MDRQRRLGAGTHIRVRLESRIGTAYKKRRRGGVCSLERKTRTFSQQQQQRNGLELEGWAKNRTAERDVALADCHVSSFTDFPLIGGRLYQNRPMRTYRGLFIIISRSAPFSNTGQSEIAMARNYQLETTSTMMMCFSALFFFVFS